MSTSFIYHAFGLQGYDYVRQEFLAGNVILTIRPKGQLVRCPECGSRDVIRRGVSERWLKTAPIGFKPVWLVVDVPRVECRDCSCVRRVDLRIADPKRWYTKAFERYARALTKKMTMQDVAELLGVGWDVIKGIQKRDLIKRFSKPPLGCLEYIAIDEISVRKGQKYLTIVYDLVGEVVVHVGEGRGMAALVPFGKRLRRTKARIRAVSTDMNNAYVRSVMDNQPVTPVVFDRFHVVKLMNDKLTKLRRQLFHTLNSPMQRQVLKGTQWILLKNPENLNQTRDEHSRLQDALKLNEPLAMGYYLKEDLRQIWGQPDKQSASAFLEDWIARVMASGVRPLMEMGKTLAARRSGILAWYDHPISTGTLEGMNNKIKAMKRQPYGFRDQEFFKLKIMGIHETKYALTG